MAATLQDHISFVKDSGRYVSRYAPLPMGNMAPIAYGGYAIALAVRSAYQEAPEGFHAYSIFGHFLRPASTKEVLIADVHSLRTSKSFAAYRVTISQKRDTEVRVIMEVTLDFHRGEASLLEFAAKPSRSYTHWSRCLGWEETERNRLATGKISTEQNKTLQGLFALARRLFETRPCPEGISEQNSMGILTDTRTTQDHLPSEERTSADWIRARDQLSTPGEQMATLAYFMDTALSFLPLVHNHLFLDDAAACSSIDFALRIFSPLVDMNQWHLRELKTHSAGSGRTYSESRLWDNDGRFVASMTEQCILRVPEARNKL